MPYGILKADTLTYYTASGDISIPVSGIAATVSGTIFVPSGTAAAPSISYVGDPDTGFYSPGANQVAIATSGTGQLFVAADGRVGIGTSAPSYPLELWRSGENAELNLNTTSAAVIGRLRIGCGNSINYIRSEGTKDLQVLTDSLERFRCDSSGRLLVGTSSSSQGTCRLLVQGNANGATNAGGLFITRGDSTPADGVNIGVIHFADSGQAPASSITAKRDGGTWTSGSSQPTRLEFSTTADGASSPTERMRISNSGVVTIKNGAVAEIGTLTDGATITPDFAANCNFTVTISGNRTMANPTNITAGQAGSVFIVQGSGSNTLGWGSYWDFPSGTAPTLSTASGAVDRVDYIVRTATSIHTVFTANYS